MSKNVLIMAGDGIGPEIMAQAEAVLRFVNEDEGLGLEFEHALVGGASIDAAGVPLTEDALALAKSADAILFGAIGGPKWEALEIAIRPEKGLLRLRSELELFGNLRPAMLYPQLASASSLKPELVSGLDILIVRELTGGIYFGQPRGIRTLENGERQGYNTYVYSESEIIRIGRMAFEAAMKRGKKLCSVDKANVLEVTELWREIMTDLSKEYPEVELSHMYVDNAAMQLIRAPKQFDVMVTGNMFGDILSDAAAMLTGSIGMLPSASLGAPGTPGLYEPVHGSAPDIAGQGIANPCAAILSLEMALRWSLGREKAADMLFAAVGKALDQGARTKDLGGSLSTSEMADAIIAAL